MSDVISSDNSKRGRLQHVKGSPVPVAWIERMFAKFEDRWGTLWQQRYAGIPIARVMKTWSEELADLTPEQIANGVNASRDLKYPPTLGEFRDLCLKVPFDPEEAYQEAVNQMYIRHSGGKDKWSHPAIFWAAVKIGYFDLRNSTWSSIKDRWSRLLEEEFAKGSWEEIPAARVALPSPGQTFACPDEVKRKIEELRAMFTSAGASR